MSVSDTLHLEQIERVVAIALSPLDYRDATAWGDALTSALCALATAEAGAFLLPGEPLAWRAVTRERDETQDDAAWRIHDEATERLGASDAGDLVFWARDDLAHSDATSQAPVTGGTVGIRVRTANGAVAALCVHLDRALGTAPPQLVAAFRAIAPAFRAGVVSWLGANASRSNVSQMLDSLADPALVFDIAGTLVHANPAADRLTPADASRLRNEAQQIAWALGATSRRRTQPAASLPRSSAWAAAERTVRMAGLVYHLHGRIVGEQLFGAQPAVLVTMTVAASEPLTDEVLHAEYGLTTRETQVARLIAEGLSNSEIATRLGVRFFTARNHVERTLAKLGVGSRQRVGPLLRNDVPGSGDPDRASAA